ncbi:MAG: hypothetical protein MUF44_01830 [Hydrogenophaga sp.]|jgi:hypothetical protein|nr:hypothetical protein [Hydrogenophaga sp.]
MAVAEITRRHVTELALAWWRRDTSPVLLHHGVLTSFSDLDERLSIYADGASLDPAEVFTHLCAQMNPTAPDFMADLVAGLFVLRMQGGVQTYSETWLKRVPDQQMLFTAYRQLMRWLGCIPLACSDDWMASLCGAPSEDHKIDDPERVRVAMQSHRPDELRFIDAWGQVQGHCVLELADPRVIPDLFSPSDLCTYILQKPQQAFDCFQQAVTRGDDPAVVFLAAGISGETGMLPHLLQSASQPEIAVLALDAFRRITGFDALAEQGLAWTHQQHIIEKTRLVLAFQAARDWFDAHGQALPGPYCFLGKRVDDTQHLLRVLRYGRQADREVAAMRAQGKTVFPVRSKVSVQQLVLDKLSPELSEAV